MNDEANSDPRREPILTELDAGRRLAELVLDIETMSTYATDVGKPIEPELAEGIAKLSAKLQVDSFERLSRALKVHGELSSFVSPVTPVSLRTTELDRRGLFRHLRVANRAIDFIGMVTFVALILFVILQLLSQYLTLHMDKYDLYKDVLSTVAVFIGAALGSGIHSSLTALPHIQRRTFDPQYNPFYMLQLLIGIAAGTIFGLFGPALVGETNAIVTLVPGLLAIVGGFSADAVMQILRRLAETLETAVKGSGGERAEERKRELQAGLAEAHRNADLAQELMKVKRWPGASDVSNEIDRIVAFLTKPPTSTP